MKMMFRVEMAYVAVLLVVAQMSAIHAVHLVCPEYQAKFAAINNVDQNGAEFKALLNETIAEMTALYMRAIGDSVERYLPGASNETQHAIEDARSSAVAQITHLPDTQGKLDNIFAANATVTAEHVSAVVTHRCNAIEGAMRMVVAMLEYENSKATNQRGPNAATPYEIVVVPADLNATVSAAVNNANKDPDAMVGAAIASVIEEARKQLSEHIVKVQNWFQTYLNGAQAPTDTTNEIINRDWIALQQDKDDIMMNMELPGMDDLKIEKPVDLVGDKLAEQIIKLAVERYSEVIDDFNEDVNDAFIDLLVWEYDSKH